MDAESSMREGVRKVPQTPLLDAAQRRAGYDRSLQLRQARAQLKAGISAGNISLVEAFDKDEAQGMKVRDLLRALPGVGGRTADRLMEWAGMSTTRSVAQMGPLQLEALLKALTA